MLFPGDFDDNGLEPYIPIDSTKNPGLASISRLLSKSEDKDDLWLAYEQGSKTLSQRLCVIKSENTMGQRQYVI